MTRNPRSRGFTLIELMIVVAIIGILAAIAYPSYRNHIQKGHRASAQAFLMDAAQRQQQYFLDNRAYAPDLGTLFGTATNDAAVPSEVSQYYTTPTFSTVLGPPPAFLITAAPKGAQATNNEPTLTIDQAGTKTPATVW
ncbi:MAG: type IV pilin protein [Pseudomonadota bacterium]